MIHPTALIDPKAQIDPTAEIGPYVVIDGAAEVGAGCKIEAHAQLVGHVVVGEGTRIGRGAVIGGEPQDLGFDPATESSVVLGRNNVIREHVTIHRGSKPGGVTRMGDGNFLMVGCHLAHDVVLGDKNIIANSVLLAGHIHVGNSTFIGGGAVFHQFLRIGDFCVVQGNGSFSKDIPHYCAAQRINRITGLNVIGLRRQGFNAEERAAIKELFQLLFCEGMNLSQAIAQAAAKEWPEKARRLLDFVQAPSKKGVCPVRPGREDD
ncbi:acyl-ACP--UDP-N-acetylglucosamine O-acyltransferase [Prosthecobacter sp.]|uniref:acyl-ACP--UDP-N-acetylglucosamine O-acyltransferase n=1 Tax=Prosthecobacter sp. TaxID=1965333 RepID=UPI001D6D2AD8|nr:acyl-ACP--UDP-N-acetylglucosamine O-acyltransferase [Prosthecobacter sp.]MCB1278734.1 acyl-ACP--UDP-N-acetylglucosamine O-acyltransferase [Prosthecobacter sp.]